MGPARNAARTGLAGERQRPLLAASAVSGQAPPAGPQWVRGLAPLEPHALAYDKPLCASLDEFTLHAPTRAGGHDAAGREALLRYVLRPPVEQERVEQRPDGLVRITLKRRLRGRDGRGGHGPPVAAVRAGHERAPTEFAHREVRRRARGGEPVEVASRAAYANSRPWPATSPERREGPEDTAPQAELLAGTLAVDVLCCPSCHGRMTLLAVIKEPARLARLLAAAGEPTEAPRRSPGRGPPYWRSLVLRRQLLGDEDRESHGRNGDEAA